ncbi:putative butyrate kinase 2 [Lacticaseibacillus paracasei]|nr:putative butyrate kinase 2 [Lacticaseibacillus paracasei]
MIDGNNGIDGEGPYSPERAGSLPLVDFVAKVLAERLTLDQVKKLLASQSGLRSYLNDISIKNIVARIAEGDETAKFYLDGMIYQIKKQIAEMAGVLNGQVDVIILTGGAAYATAVTAPLQHDLAWIAPVVVRPGEMEMQALYEGVMRVLNHEEPVRVYQSDASTIKGGTGR